MKIIFISQLKVYNPKNVTQVNVDLFYLESEKPRQPLEKRSNVTNIKGISLII